MNKDMKQAGLLVHLLLNDLCERVTVGNTGNNLNSYAEYALKRYCPEAILACKGFHGFPKSICVSINDGIIHGIPDDRAFAEGDIIKIDLVGKYRDFFADSARTVICGEGSEEDKRLVKTCKECLYKGIAVAIAGNTVGNIGFIIKKHANRHNYSVIREFSGHGIGQSIHQEPSIPCFGKKGKGYILKEGMYICIEPMLFMGKSDIERGENGWNVKSKDKSLTAHFEHTILITKNSPLILT